MTVTEFVPAGKLRKRIQLLRRNDSQDAFAQATGYTSYATVWAGIESAQGTEVFRAGTYTEEISHVITTRWSNALTVKSNDRVIYNGRTFDIRVILNPDERNRYLLLLCVELADGTAAGA